MKLLLLVCTKRSCQKIFLLLLGILQSSTLDIIDWQYQIFYMSLREKISNEFNKVYQQAETMGASINVDPSRPRSCARQRNRPNIATDDWYKVNVAIPFIDHIIAELDSQFSQLANTASQLLCLVTSIMCNKTNRYYRTSKIVQ